MYFDKKQSLIQFFLPNKPNHVEKTPSNKILISKCLEKAKKNVQEETSLNNKRKTNLYFSRNFAEIIVFIFPFTRYCSFDWTNFVSRSEF